MQNQNPKNSQSVIRTVPSVDEYLDPLKYGIDIDAVKLQIEQLRGHHNRDPRPKETFSADLRSTYQNFAREHLGFEFNDIRYFITALTHRSYVNEHRNVIVEHNERLEFLGDAILEMMVSDFLFRHFNEPEGLMTAWRSSLVRTESIGAASREIGYIDLIRLSRGEKSRVGTRAHDNIIADCFEAVSGAIYVDQGYDAVKKHVYKYILSRMPFILEDEGWRDPKSHLQEMAQKNDGTTPQYRLIRVDGPDHSRVFTVDLVIGGVVRGHGVGNSKQEAQIMAAKQGIEYYKSLGNISDNGKLSSSSL